MLEIRKAIIGDAAAILNIHEIAIYAKAANHYTTSILTEWAAGLSPERLRQVAEEIIDPSYLVLVGIFEKKIIGFGMARPQVNELRALYVKPNRIGPIGTMLLKELEKMAFGAGATYLTCDASLNAKNFYAKNGYRTEGYGEHTLGSGTKIPCIKMTKELSFSQIKK